MSAENTNAGGRARLTLNLSNKLNEEVERLAAANGVTKDDVLRFARELLAKKADAALSAHSTGSAGAAAEPVAWAYEELKTYTFDTWEHALSYEKPELAPHHRKIEPLFKHPPVATNPAAWLWEYIDKVGVWHEISSVEKPNPEGRRDIRPLYEHPPVAAEPVEDLSGPLKYAEMRRDFWINEAQRLAILVRELGGDPEPVAAAPTPPAGGGETERLFRQSLADHPIITETLRAAEPSPASPAGDLISLSAGATPGTLSVSGSRRRYDEPSCVIVDASSCRALFALATGERGKDALQSLADAKFIAGLWNAFREGRLVEAAPAAPRKGPSEEEIRHAQIRLQQARNCIHGGSAGSSTAEMLRAIAGTAISWPLDGGMYPHHVRERASLLEAAIKLTDFDLAALLTPADRGETQAVAKNDGVANVFEALWLDAEAECGKLATGVWPSDKAIAEAFHEHRCETDRRLPPWSEVMEGSGIWKHSYNFVCRLRSLPVPSPSPDQNRGEPDQGGEAR